MAQAALITLMLVSLTLGVALSLFAFAHLRLWLAAACSNAPVPFTRILEMRLRRAPPRPIVAMQVRAIKGGVRVTSEQLLEHHLAGGDLERTVAALIAAKHGGIDLAWADACLIDLDQDQDVLQAVRESFLSQPRDATAPQTEA